MPAGLVYPGGDDEPGTRNIPSQYQDHLFGTTDTSGVIPVITYNFQHDIGTVLSTPATNVITEPQKQRVREVLSYYASLIGVEFVETSGAADWIIARGDVHAVSPTAADGIGVVAAGKRPAFLAKSS